MANVWRGDWAQKARLVSGLVLFAFALTHFLNHAVGLYDLRLMEQVQDWRMQVTRYNPVGRFVLGSAIAIHMVFGIWRLLRRRTLRMPAWEWSQMIMGLLIPVFLIPHIVHTRIAGDLFGVSEFYRFALADLWPDGAWMQSAALILVWTHGCVGLHYWLRSTRWWQSARPVLLGLAVLIPAAALAGFMVAGRRVARMVNHPPSFERLKTKTHWPDESQWDALQTIAQNAVIVAAVTGAVCLLFVPLRSILRKHVIGMEIDYRYGPKIRSPRGSTLLEISRENRVPHASLCGGRGRCTTCRVLIEAGAENLPPPGPLEQASLKSIGAAEGTRLACQIKPIGNIAVHRLYRQDTKANVIADNRWGEEAQRAILFLDVRDFTRISAGRLPYDVIFLLNRFFGAITPRIEHHGGIVDKYMGDGLIAVFGTGETPEDACREAIAAAADIDHTLEALNETLDAEGHEQLRIAMGLHVGEIVIGAVGSGASASRTIIGETVNTASRLETLCKSLDVQLVMSGAVVSAMNFTSAVGDLQKVDVRGLSGQTDILAVERARDLV